MLFRVKKHKAMFFKILKMNLAPAFLAEARSSSPELQGLQGPGARGKPGMAVPAPSLAVVPSPALLHPSPASWHGPRLRRLPPAHRQPSSSSHQQWPAAQTDSRWMGRAHSAFLPTIFQRTSRSPSLTHADFKAQKPSKKVFAILPPASFLPYLGSFLTNNCLYFSLAELLLIPEHPSNRRNENAGASMVCYSLCPAFGMSLIECAQRIRR